MSSIIREENLEKHPIENIMDSTFGKMRSITDADMIVGNAIITSDGMTVIPISKISLGIVSGGGEYGLAKFSEFPFAGASGAGVTVSPVCFLISDGKSVKLLNVEGKSAVDRAIDNVPDIIGSLFGKKKR